MSPDRTPSTPAQRAVEVVGPPHITRPLCCCTPSSSAVAGGYSDWTGCPAPAIRRPDATLCGSGVSGTCARCMLSAVLGLYPMGMWVTGRMWSCESLNGLLSADAIAERLCPETDGRKRRTVRADCAIDPAPLTTGASGCSRTQHARPSMRFCTHPGRSPTRRWKIWR